MSFSSNKCEFSDSKALSGKGKAGGSAWELGISRGAPCTHEPPRLSLWTTTFEHDSLTPSEAKLFVETCGHTNPGAGQSEADGEKNSDEDDKIGELNSKTEDSHLPESLDKAGRLELSILTMIGCQW